MKKVIWLPAMTVLLLLLSACSISPADAYDNFMNDLDVIVRIETGIQQRKDGMPNPYVEADMKTLAEDLNTLRTNDKDILRINEYFIEAVQNLRESTALLSQDEIAAEEAYERAKDAFGIGLELFSRLPTSGGGPINGG